jgi:glycosyltransferase involved in cell wall biosynthesis
VKILHINKFLYRRGGAEAYMEDLAELQAGAGHEIAYFGMAHPNNVHNRYAAHFPSHVDLEPAPDGLVGKARGAARMLWSTSARRGLETVLSDFAPDVVHLHNIYHQLSPSILGPLARRGIPAVMTLHDYKLACPSYQFLAGGQVCTDCLGGHFSKSVSRRCKDGSLGASALLGLETFLHNRFGAYGPIRRFICPSRFMADMMGQGNVFPDRLRHVPHFIDPAGVAGSTVAGRDIAFAGRLSHEKGVDTLIAAMAFLPEARLSIAGEGPAGEVLQAQAAATAPGRIDFLGRLPRREVHDLVRSSAVLAAPSRWFENQPMIILEALACGTPVVATHLGGTPELIAPGVDGDLTPADDPAALAFALQPFVADPELALDMGQAGRRKVLAQFSPESHLERVHAVYGEATETTPRRQSSTAARH